MFQDQNIPTTKLFRFPPRRSFGLHDRWSPLRQAQQPRIPLQQNHLVAHRHRKLSRLEAVIDLCWMLIPFPELDLDLHFGSNVESNSRTTTRLPQPSDWPSGKLDSCPFPNLSELFFISLTEKVHRPSLHSNSQLQNSSYTLTPSGNISAFNIPALF